MDTSSLLITAMAERCRDTILGWHGPQRDLPTALQPAHLQWMCNEIEDHADEWPVTKLHRWVGFVQCAMLANRMLDLKGAKALFKEAKVAFGEISEDLLDHLDPTSSFELDIGGEA